MKTKAHNEGKSGNETPAVQADKIALEFSASALPWSVAYVGKTRAFGGSIIDAAGNQVALVTVPRSGSDKERKANAALIIRAVNNHESLLSAAKKFLAFYHDLSDSNPGFMGRLTLQDYAQWNEAMIELPRAIAIAKTERNQ